MSYEFPDFDYSIAPLIAQLPPGWLDNSWHNDTMPCAVTSGGDGLWLWFDYADPEMSEHATQRASGDMKQFSLCTCNGDTWFETDSWTEMRDWIHANTARIRSFVDEQARWEKVSEYFEEASQ